MATSGAWCVYSVSVESLHRVRGVCTVSYHIQIVLVHVRVVSTDNARLNMRQTLTPQTAAVILKSDRALAFVL